MIRGWFRRPQPGVRRRTVDEATFIGAQLDVRDAQIEGLRDALCEAHRQLAIVSAELATYKTRAFMVHALRLRARLAEEPTAVVSADQFRRTRPAGPAPATEQYRRPR